MLARFIAQFGLFISLLGLSLLVIASRALGAEKLMSYKDWKSEKIHVSADKIRSLKIKLAQAKAIKDRDSQKNFEQEISQEDWRLNIAKELNIKDYMVLHVAAQPGTSTQKFQELASLLSKEEIAQILENYVQLVAPVQAELPQMRVQALTNER